LSGVWSHKRRIGNAERSQRIGNCDKPGALRIVSVEESLFKVEELAITRMVEDIHVDRSQVDPRSQRQYGKRGGLKIGERKECHLSCELMNSYDVCFVQVPVQQLGARDEGSEQNGQPIDQRCPDV
jgi:hypothetical protein